MPGIFTCQNCLFSDIMANSAIQGFVFFTLWRGASTWSTGLKPLVERGRPHHVITPHSADHSPPPPTATHPPPNTFSTQTSGVNLAPRHIIDWPFLRKHCPKSIWNLSGRLRWGLFATLPRSCTCINGTFRRPNEGLSENYVSSKMVNWLLWNL